MQVYGSIFISFGKSLIDNKLSPSCFLSQARKSSLIFPVKLNSRTGYSVVQRFLHKYVNVFNAAFAYLPRGRHRMTNGRANVLVSLIFARISSILLGIHTRYVHHFVLYTRGDLFCT